MDMFNVFKAPTNAFDELLYINGQQIYHNGKKKNAIITNPEIKEFNDKYISSDFKLVRGDYIHYDNTYWMVWNQVNVSRADSFKGIMRQAEHDVVFNLYYAGVTSNYLLKAPAIIQRTSDYTMRADDMMTTIDSEIHVFVQDTASTRRIVDLMNKSDGQIVLGERNYDIIGVSFEKKGYLDVTCRMGTRNSGTDYKNNIYWNANGKPSDWANQFDLSFYEQEGQGTTLPVVPDNYQTNVTFSTFNVTEYTSTQAGSFTANWTEEGNKNTYADFKGYKVRLLQNGSELVMNMTNDTSATFTNLSVGDYVIEVTSRFGNNNTILPVTSVTINVVDGDAPIATPDTDTTDVTVKSYNDSNSYGTLVWTPEVDKNAYEDFYGYRVEVYTSSLFGGDTRKDYWVTTTEQQDIRTGWNGEMGWYVLIYSIFQTSNGEVLMQPKKFTGDELTALPDTDSNIIW